MARPLRLFYPGAKYHITSRGNGRQQIFIDTADYERFLDQLDAALEADGVVLYAYALMPNHYHLFVETPQANIKRFMQRVNTAYGMYFRYRHSKPGHCFQGRYGAKLINGDEYILCLTRYIHLNPVKTRQFQGVKPSDQVQYLRSYSWSSYPGYCVKGSSEERISYRWLQMMGRGTRARNSRAYRSYVERFVNKEDGDFLDALGASRYAIGDDRFLERTETDIKDLQLSRYSNDIVWPAAKVVDLEAVEGAVSKEFGVSVEDLHFYGHRAGIVKAIAIELCCELTGRTQREIADRYGYKSDSSIGKQRKRLRSEVQNNVRLRRRIDRVRNAVRCC